MLPTDKDNVPMNRYLVTGGMDWIKLPMSVNIDGT